MPSESKNSVPCIVWRVLIQLTRMVQALIMPSLVCTLLKYAAEVGKVKKGYSRIIFSC